MLPAFDPLLRETSQKFKKKGLYDAKRFLEQYLSNDSHTQYIHTLMLTIRISVVAVTQCFASVNNTIYWKVVLLTVAIYKQ